MKLSLFLSIATSAIILFPYLYPTKVNAYTYCDLKTDYYYSPEQRAKINYWTDYFFFLFRPELKDKQIVRSQKLYQREKAGIRGVVKRVLLCGAYWEHQNYYLEKIYLAREPENPYWLLINNYVFDGFYAELTDAVFYAHHLGLPPKKSNFKNLNWSTEWINIRQSFASYQQENNLFAEFLPIFQPIKTRDRIITIEQLRRLTNNENYDRYRYFPEANSGWERLR